MAKFHLTTKLGYMIYLEVEDATYFYRGQKRFSDNPENAQRYTRKNEAEKVAQECSEVARRSVMVTTIQ